MLLTFVVLLTFASLSQSYHERHRSYEDYGHDNNHHYYGPQKHHRHHGYQGHHDHHGYYGGHYGGYSNIYRKQDDYGNYAFGYHIKDPWGATNFRKESGDAWGNKRGSYGLKDVDGRERIVKYVADKGGFRAKIQTNEPGTSSLDSADAVYNGPDHHGYSHSHILSGHRKHHEWGHHHKHHEKDHYYSYF